MRKQRKGWGVFEVLLAVGVAFVMVTSCAGAVVSVGLGVLLGATGGVAQEKEKVAVRSGQVVELALRGEVDEALEVVPVADGVLGDPEGARVTLEQLADSSGELVRIADQGCSPIQAEATYTDEHGEEVSGAYSTGYSCHVTHVLEHDGAEARVMLVFAVGWTSREDGSRDMNHGVTRLLTAFPVNERGERVEQVF